MAIDIFEQERGQFSALKDWTYVDHGSAGLVPRYAVEAMKAHLEYRNRDGIAVCNLWDYADTVREKIGRMIGCDSDEVVYGQSSTQLLNIFADSIPLSAGDNIVTTDGVFPADAYVWLNKANEGIELRYAPMSVDGITPEQLMSYTNEHTRAVLLCMAENGSGWRHDVKTIGRLCHEKGILFIVDVTQCINALRIDVRDMNIDMLTSSTYKWMLGLVGLGFGYIRRELMQSLRQSVCGWVGSVDRRNNIATELRLSGDAKRYELGGISFTALLGLEQVINRYFELGPEKIEARIMELVRYTYSSEKKRLARIMLTAEFPTENRSGLVMFRIPEGMTVTDDMLAAHGVRARVMHGTTIRTGLHYMNNFKDVDRLIDALCSIEKVCR